MKYIILVIALTAPISAFATASFDERAREAHRLERASDQRAYQATLRSRLAPKMNKLMARCARMTNGARPRPFAVVGDITRTSSVVNIKVKPSSAFAKCFASALSSISLPAPPDSFAGNTYPIAMDMTFH